MNLQRVDFNETAVLTAERPQSAVDPVQLTVVELERCGRDLRSVTLDEFKSLLTQTAVRQAAHREHLVSC